MIRLKIQDLLTATQMRRPLYRATCKDEKVRMGYLCFYIKKHFLRPSTEVVCLRESASGKLYKFRPESLAIWTQVNDKNGKPICNGDIVIRHDSYTGKSSEGVIAYSRDIAGFVWNSTDRKYKRIEPLYGNITVSDNNHEFQVQYTYEIVKKHTTRK